MWAIIGGFKKTYGDDFESIIHRSYRALIMYNAVIPSYDSDKTKKDNKKINASDPKNKGEVHKILFGD